MWNSLARIAVAMLALSAVGASESNTPAVRAERPTNVPRPWIERLRDPRPIIEGHRTCWRQVAENSLDGIKMCADHGIDAVEIDVRATRDGVLVLMHDDTLERTTTMSGAVAERSYQELQQGWLRQHDGGPDAPRTSERVPTLRDALRTGKGRIVMILDVKVPLYEQIIAAVVEEHAEEWVVLPAPERPSTPAFAALPEWLRRNTPVDVTQCAATERTRDCVDALADGLKALDSLPRPRVLGSAFHDDEFVRRGAGLARQKGFRLGGASLHGGSGGRHEELAGADPRRLWSELLDLGIDVIITDRPLELDEYLRSTGRR